MIDKKKVIKGMTEFINGFIPSCSSDGELLVLMTDALTALAEQPNVVRCGDCKYAEHLPTGLLKCNGHFRSPNWYCADGAKE